MTPRTPLSYVPKYPTGVRGCETPASKGAPLARPAHSAQTLSMIPEVPMLLKPATDVRLRAYAPYSRFKVGAAIRATIRALPAQTGPTASTPEIPSLGQACTPVTATGSTPRAKA